MRSQIPACLAVALVAMLSMACPGPGYPKCDGDRECADRKEVCVFGQCHGCALDEHCASGMVCHNYQCEAPTTCVSSGDCKDGRVCKAGTCQVECRVDAECAAPATCVANHCTAPAAPVCKEHKDCGAGMACRSGACFKPVPGDAEYEAVYGPVTGGVGTPATGTANTGPGNSGIDGTGPRLICGMEARAYFAFNEAVLTDESRETLNKVGECLKQQPSLNISVQGHTDERGTSEYNLALGERRALSALAYLKNLGIAESRIGWVSVGEERPLDSGHDEAAWAKNRRAEVLPR